ncbi:hypothetical protein [Siccibacter colletis]|uniref:hypothetical protein n=1 Tax=Siccibacter colletis TaxID=1505757 RepID=UPI003CEDE48F
MPLFLFVQPAGDISHFRRKHSVKVPGEYCGQLTGLGKEMLLAMLLLWNWIISNSVAFRASREAHEQRHGAA